MNKTLLTSTLLILCLTTVLAQRIRITHGPYLQNMTDSEVTVVWVTDRSAVSWVEIAPDDRTHFYLTERTKIFAAKNGIKTEGTVHTVKLNRLAPATKYRYRVVSQEVLDRDRHEITYGKMVATTAYQPFTFTTFDMAKTDFTFSMLNDIHGRSGVMDTLLSHVNPLTNDLVFFNGDMVSSLSNEDVLFNGFMDTAVNSFASNVPMFYARGNHETRGTFATSFQNYFSPLKTELYYMVRQGQTCFVVLDCGEDKPDSDVEYSGITDYDAYRTNEAEWLANALRSREFTEAKFKIVICHMPPIDDWHGEAEILHKFVPLLNDAGIDIMLCGHTHRHLKKAADAEVRFPVLINSNNAVVKGTVKAGSISLDVLDVAGKKVDSIIINK